MSVKLEIFSGSLKLAEGTAGLYRISGVAIHPCKTYHPKEWGKIREYIEPYLERAAPTLTKVPVTLNHGYQLPGCKITLSVWKDGELIYEGVVTARIADLIRNGEIQHVSVGVDWQKPGGGIIVGEEGQVIPYAFEFNEFSLLQNMEPGDPMSTIRLWEGLAEGILKNATDQEMVAIRKRAFQLQDEARRKEKIKTASVVDANHKPTTPEVATDPVARLRRLMAE
jgi:hypothetical protein